MCGITGVLGNSSGHSLEQDARRMAGTLFHRGPDDGGVWADSAAGIALGHRRLSILDLSPAGHQPMVSLTGRYVIAFNGEIYNHLELRRDLKNIPSPQPLSQGARGHNSWRGHSDTETLLVSFEAWGVEKALKRAVGMFALALWDRQERTLTLARDRIGEKPLYYGWQGGNFLFGSELMALRAHPSFRAEVDRDALSLFLRHNYIPAPYSIYKGIRKLLPGSFLQLRAGQCDAEPVFYWSLTDAAGKGAAQPFDGSDDEALDALEQHLNTAVRSQMLADVPLGALLSGGLDSTLVTALMQANSNHPVRTFTIGFNERVYDEAAHARTIAAHLGTDHSELRLTPSDALALVPNLSSIYDEPFADSSQLPTHLVMKFARQQVTVAMSGDGGDEVFGGYNRYVHVPRIWKRLRWAPHFLRQTLGAGLTAIPSRSLNTILQPLMKWTGIAQPGDKAHKLGQRIRHIRNMDDFYLSLVSEWSEAPSIVIGAKEPSTLLTEIENWPAITDPVARMMLLDTLTYLPEDILVKVDRAAMAVSLETRAPFLDRRVIEFAWTLPMRMKIRNGQGKWLLRRLLERHVPRDLLKRPKMGFAIPLDQWLRGPLREWAECLLAEDRLRSEGYLDPAPIRQAWQAHLAGGASCGYRLWSVLMFQAWLSDSRVSG